MVIKTFRLYFFAMACFFGLISLSYADSVRLIDSPHDALSIRYEMIKKAQDKILISYFIFADDETAMEFLSLLRQKAMEGVEVKLLVDSIFNDIPKSMATHLTQSGVEIKQFNKFNIFRLFRAANRLHDKLLLIDSEEMITGGRNIEDTYYERAIKNYHDRDIYIRGEIVSKIEEYYYALWDANHVTPVKKIKIDVKRKKKREKNLKKVSDSSILMDETYANLINKEHAFDLNKWLEETVEVEEIDFSTDLIQRKKQRVTGTAAKLYEELEKAQKSVIIDSPYLIMTKELKSIFEKLLARGVYIRVLTNSLKATDGILPQAGYLSQRRKIAKMGIDLHEFFSHDSFHAKSFVIDDKIAVVGSFNLDPLSQNHNTEVLAFVYDEEVALKLRESMDQSLDQAYKIDENGRPENTESRLPGVSFGKRLTTRLIQYLLVPIFKGYL